MGPALYQEFIAEWEKTHEGLPLTTLLFAKGIEGILDEFEGWLQDNRHICPYETRPCKES